MKEHTIYAEHLEGDVLNQFYSALSQPYSVKGALMPDAHLGYSLPIGGVVATEDMILPSWVGYDIGCGMCAYQTDVSKSDIEPFKNDIFQSIYREIPTGAGINKKAEKWDYSHLEMTSVLESIFEKYNGLKALSSLGSGNHFIEIGYDEDETVWIIIHSGSRKIGWELAHYYMKLASNSRRTKDGHFAFHVYSSEGKDYVNDMNFCLDFALENRKRMIEKVYKEIIYYVKKENKKGVTINYKKIKDKQFINRNHNHAELNEKEKIWIHRKGATHAEEGMYGVIPGNMKDGSFIVRGKGNPKSLYSSSHGAGRVLSRKDAKVQLNLDDFVKSMDGVTAKVNHSTLDESPSAYKNIFEVMDLQKDLVEVIHHVKPIINIKA